MNVLADTQILVWSLDTNSSLSNRYKEILLDVSNRIVVSQISLMELVIKKAIGKLPDFIPAINDLADNWLKNGYEIFAVI